MHHVKSLLMPLVLLVLLAGCAKEPKPLKVYWPPPPDEPKLEWIVTFSSNDNFPKTESERMTESVIGKQDLSFFSKPQGVVSDGRGIVYVADMDARNLRVIDFNARTMNYYSKEPFAATPLGLALDGSGNLYVSDAMKRHILVFDANRNPVRIIGDRKLLQKPTFIALNERLGRLYVSDVMAHRVVVFDLQGNHLFSFGTPGGGKGELYGPQGIAIDEQDQVFVAEQFNARVQVFDADGNSLSYFGTRGDNAFQFEGPRGLAFDSQGHLYVAEARKAALLVFNKDGQPLTGLGGKRTTHQLGFTMPTGVTVDANDRIYVTDAMNRRMTIWQYLTDDYLRQNPLNPEVLQELEKKVRSFDRK